MKEIEVWRSVLGEGLGVCDTMEEIEKERSILA